MGAPTLFGAAMKKDSSLKNMKPLTGIAGEELYRRLNKKEKASESKTMSSGLAIGKRTDINRM